MVTASENERTVIDVLAGRFAVPVEHLEPGRVTVVSTPKASAAVRAFVHRATPPDDDGSPTGGSAAHPESGVAARAGGSGAAAGVPGSGEPRRVGARTGASGGLRTEGRAAAGEEPGGILVMARPEHVELAERLLGGLAPRAVEAGLAELASTLGGRLVGVVARTGLVVPPPEVEVSLTTASDRRLPDWVIGHFNGPAWVVLSPDGRVLSTAVLKDYDERLREISVGTKEEARGRGLARAVVRAAARNVLAGGRAVLYLHDIGNHASASVAAAAGLEELGRLVSVVGERLGDG